MTRGGEDLLGHVLEDRYELRDLVAGGAQGFLFRARDLKDGDDVAVKVLRHGAQDPNALERLMREAQAMTQLTGTAAVRVYDQVRTSDGAVAIVMEFLRGRELAAELAELEASGERMARERLFEIFPPIVETLEAARAVGIVHRDIKPENIFVIHAAYGGGVRLLDFGFARFTRRNRITAEGMIAGSPSHIAPEVWKGATDIDHRADVYGLAVVLFRALAGRVPFSGKNFLELMQLVTTGARPKLAAERPDLKPAIDHWVEHALAADRELRFQRVTALWNALKACL